MPLHPRWPTKLCLLCRHTVQPYQRTSIALHPPTTHHINTASELSSDAGRPPPRQPFKQPLELRHELRTQESLSSPLDLIYTLFERKAPKKIPLFDDALKKTKDKVHPDVGSTPTVEDVYSTAHRHMIFAQLSQCNDINSILRVAYTCFKNPSPELGVRALSDYLLRNVYRYPDRGVSYDDMLAAVHIIRFRLGDQGLEWPESLSILGLVLGARCRSYPSIRPYLEECGKKRYTLPPIHLLDILRRGLKPSRPKTPTESKERMGFSIEEIDAILFGYPDPSGNRLQSSISALVDRSDWRILEAWLRFVAAGGHSDQLWTEWESWLNNPVRAQLTAPDHTREVHEQFARKDGSFDLQACGDNLLVNLFISLSDWQKAWAIIAHSKMAPEALNSCVLDQLIEHSEHEPADFWISSGETLRAVYARKLKYIEEQLGVLWVWNEEEGVGWHVIDTRPDSEKTVFIQANERLSHPATQETTSKDINPQFFTPVEEREEVPQKEEEKEKAMIGSSGDSWLDDYM